MLGGNVIGNTKKTAHTFIHMNAIGSVTTLVTKVEVLNVAHVRESVTNVKLDFNAGQTEQMPKLCRKQKSGCGKQRWCIRHQLYICHSERNALWCGSGKDQLEDVNTEKCGKCEERFQCWTEY